VVDHVIPQQSTWDEFICDMAIAFLTEAAEVIAPELLPAELAEEYEFDVLCQELLSAGQS
jgi:hypothetical protein